MLSRFSMISIDPQTASQPSGGRKCRRLETMFQGWSKELDPFRPENAVSSGPSHNSRRRDQLSNSLLMPPRSDRYVNTCHHQSIRLMVWIMVLNKQKPTSEECEVSWGMTPSQPVLCGCAQDRTLTAMIRPRANRMKRQNQPWGASAHRRSGGRRTLALSNRAAELGVTDID